MFEDCLEDILKDIAKVELIPLSDCKFPFPANVPDIAIMSATFGKPLLTLAMDDTGDGNMDASPTLRSQDQKTIAGHTVQHTLSCVVNEGLKAVRQKAASIYNIDIVPLITLLDGQQRTIIPLPNTSNFTIQENQQAGANTITVQLVAQSMSGVIELE